MTYGFMMQHQQIISQCHWMPEQTIPMCASLNASKDKGSVGEVWYILYSSSTMYYFCYILS